MEVEHTLTFRDDCDISGKYLEHEIQNLPDLLSDKMTAFELLSFLCEKNREELYPNYSHSTSNSSIGREELFKIKAHQKLPEVFHVTGTFESFGHHEHKS